MKSIHLNDITFNYASNRPIFRTLKSVFEQDRDAGKIIALTGLSGSGKTTLLKMMLGTLTPHQGRVSFSTSSPVISYVPQEPVLFDHLSPLENARYFSRIAFYKNLFDESLFNRLSDRLGMTTILEEAKKVGQLSGGQRQRLLLLRALSIKPDYLFLDEPTTGLDADVKLSFLNELRKIVVEQRILAVYVTHHRQEAEFAADEIAFLGMQQQAGPTHLYQLPISQFLLQPPALEAVGIFYYPTPNILRCTWQEGEAPLLQVKASGHSLVVPPDSVKFITGGTPFTIDNSNPIYTVIDIEGQKLTVRTTKALFGEGVGYQFNGRVLLYQQNDFVKEIYY